MALFFQAEDGIRDYKVTGVQTCALPISDALDAALDEVHERFGSNSLTRATLLGRRSEERRVGKECGCRRYEYYKREHGSDQYGCHGREPRYEYGELRLHLHSL